MVEEGLEKLLALKERIRRANALAAGAAFLPGDFALQGFHLFNELGFGLSGVFDGVSWRLPFETLPGGLNSPE
jgi:hypothetical protein